MEIMVFLTNARTEYYEIHTSMKPGTGKTIGRVVEYSMEDEIKGGTGVNCKEYLDNWKKHKSRI